MTYCNRLPGGGYGYCPGNDYRTAQQGLGLFAELVPLAITVGEQVFGGGGGGGSTAPWSSWFDNSPYSLCSGQEPHATALAVVNAMTYAEKSTLSGLIRTANAGAGPSVAELTDPNLLPYWTKAIYGGQGCGMAAHVAGQNLDKLRDWAARVGVPWDSGIRLYQYWQEMKAKYSGAAGSSYPSNTTPPQPTYQPPETGLTIPGTDITVSWPTGGAPPPPAPPTTAGMMGGGAGLLLPLGLLAALFVIGK